MCIRDSNIAGAHAGIEAGEIVLKTGDPDFIFDLQLTAQCFDLNLGMSFSRDQKSGAGNRSGQFLSLIHI